MTACPLCGSKVIYFGITQLECSGPKCDNYKPSSLDEWKPLFDDTLVDWTWLVPFCGWLTAISGIITRPKEHDSEFFLVESDTSDFGFFVDRQDTKNGLLRFLIRDRDWGGVLAPKVLRGELQP